MIASAVVAKIHNQLDHERFAVCSNVVKLHAGGRVHVPDIVVFRPSADLDADAASNPVVVVEIVSPATHIRDRFEKNVDYATLDGIRQYLMIWEREETAVLCTRTGDGWLSEDVGSSGRIALAAIGVELKLGDLYPHIPGSDRT